MVAADARTGAKASNELLSVATAGVSAETLMVLPGVRYPRRVCAAEGTGEPTGSGPLDPAAPPLTIQVEIDGADARGQLRCGRVRLLHELK